MRTTRVFLVVACSLFAACNDDDSGGARIDPAQLTNSSGEVTLADGSQMEFSITSERYKQWDAARRALDKKTAARFGARLQPSAPTEQSISRAVAYLEQDARSRQAIERTGLSARGFVELTVALEQQMRLAGGQGGAREPRSLPAPYPPPIDSSYMPATPVTPVPVEPRPSEPVTRLDTLFPTPRPAPRDTVRRDSLPKRDSTLPRRDIVVAPKPPPPRDTARDTLRPPPDTLRST